MRLAWWEVTPTLFGNRLRTMIIVIPVDIQARIERVQGFLMRVLLQAVSINTEDTEDWETMLLPDAEWRAGVYSLLPAFVASLPGAKEFQNRELQQRLLSTLAESEVTPSTERTCSNCC